MDLSAFAMDSGDLEIKYGLPGNINFCNSCVISNQKPTSEIEFEHTRKKRKSTVAFDDQMVCDACHTVAKKEKTDWESRERELVDLCNRYRRTDGRYDCLVPGSGGKDSFYAAHLLKYKYGMHPLTVTWAPHLYTDWGFQNFQAWIHAGFDNFKMTPDGRTHRLLTRLALENLFHPFQPFVIGQKVLAPKMSVLMDIPLVFFGENEAEYGNPRSDNSFSQRDLSYFTSDRQSEVVLGGVPVRQLIEDYGIQACELEPYKPSDPEAIRKTKTEVHYLGYYVKWHPQSAYYYAVEHGDFVPSPERTPGTYSKYNSIDDRIDDFHYYTTYIKFGIGRATYDAAQECRSGDISRDEAMALVRKYDGEFPERFADEIFRYLSIPEKQFPRAHKMFEQPVIDRQYFDLLADSFRSPHIWAHADGQWKLRKTVYGHLA
ncbi:N-acetyl sugar amidotransferase [Magnetospira sp. QH-2]|uniref:N-acetyl sugar amidotransferase n=1 Tax=Magnetospira sp. (strain QH-2) TaxID=1288970 RepID=UPI00208E4EE8|nr:N-acetyl sugar amidotransferase [Magnetospira sp. QH-2]